MSLDFNDVKIPVFERWFGSWQVSVNRRGFATSELSAAYDAEAGLWEEKIARLGFPGGYRRLVRAVLPALSDGAGQQLDVLDCGIGTGTLSLAFAAEVRQPYALSAVDISPCMLSEACGNLRHNGVSVDASVSDIRDMPHPGNRFDLVMCAHVIEHLPDPKAALQEIHRVLKPGGHLLLVATRKSWIGAYIQLKWRTHRLSQDKIAGWLKESGLEVLEVPETGQGRWMQSWSTAFLARKIIN
ncbi:methyltransferase domain-containing protein [Roseibium sp. MB-4]